MRGHRYARNQPGRPVSRGGALLSIEKLERDAIDRLVEPTKGIEPSTSSLPRTRSTTELGGQVCQQTADLSRIQGARHGGTLGTSSLANLRGSRNPTFYFRAFDVGASNFMASTFGTERETGLEPATFSLEG